MILYNDIMRLTQTSTNLLKSGFIHYFLYCLGFPYKPVCLWLLMKNTAHYTTKRELSLSQSSHHLKCNQLLYHANILSVCIELLWFFSVFDSMVLQWLLLSLCYQSTVSFFSGILWDGPLQWCVLGDFGAPILPCAGPSWFLSTVVYEISLQSLADIHLDTLSGCLVHRVAPAIQHGTLRNSLYT